MSLCRTFCFLVIAALTFEGSAQAGLIGHLVRSTILYPEVGTVHEGLDASYVAMVGNADALAWLPAEIDVEHDRIDLVVVDGSVLPTGTGDDPCYCYQISGVIQTGQQIVEARIQTSAGLSASTFDGRLTFNADQARLDLQGLQLPVGAIISVELELLDEAVAYTPSSFSRVKALF